LLHINKMRWRKKLKYTIKAIWGEYATVRNGGDLGYMPKKLNKLGPYDYLFIDTIKSNNINIAMNENVCEL